MRLTTIVLGGILSSVAGVSLACELPKLAIIPPKDQIAAKKAEVDAAVKTYIDAMTAYTACVQAELQAAGGDAAPDLVKRVLVSRNNTAAAEAQFMMKLYTDATSSFSALSGVVPGAPAAPAGAPATPPAN
jgi:hypothetical protein